MFIDLYIKCVNLAPENGSTYYLISQEERYTQPEN